MGSGLMARDGSTTKLESKLVVDPGVRVPLALKEFWPVMLPGDRPEPGVLHSVA